MEYRIREVEEDDLEEIQKIEQDSFPYPFSRWQFWWFYAQEKENFLVAETQGEIIGYIIGSKSFRRITVSSLAVKEGYRNKGIATSLVDKFIEQVKPKFKRLELQVRVSNKKALALYNKLGFQRIKTILGYYQDGEDAFLYQKKLAQFKTPIRIPRSSP